MARPKPGQPPPRPAGPIPDPGPSPRPGPAIATQTLGETIRAARTRVGSLRQLANYLGLAPSYLSDIENDRRVPAEITLREIARRLSLNPDDLLARAGRFGDDAERYLRRNPAIGALLRRLAELRLSEADLGRVARYAEKLKGGSSDGEKAAH
jgi:transcriptional regulator with XRE-family HTH domain